MSRLGTPRKPIERYAHNARTEGFGVAAHLKTTMCAMCNKIIPSHTGAIIKTGNGRWLRVCDEHAPKRRPPETA